MQPSSLRVCLLAGSAGHPSHTRTCLDLLAQQLRLLETDTHTWDLAQTPLPLFDPHFYPDPHKNASTLVRKLAALTEQADAFIWGSPVYHNSFSGVLKNALDSLSLQQFHHKPVAFVSCGNNDRTASQPCDQLRCIARGLHAVAIPTQIVALPTDFVRTQQGYILIDEGLKARLALLAQELCSYAFALRHVRAALVETALHGSPNGARHEKANV